MKNYNGKMIILKFIIQLYQQCKELLIKKIKDEIRESRKSLASRSLIFFLIRCENFLFSIDDDREI